MFGIGTGELLVIILIALLFVGPEKLPGAAKSIGKGLRQLRNAADNVRNTVEQDEDLKSAIGELRSVGQDLQREIGDIGSRIMRQAEGAKPSTQPTGEITKLPARARYAVSKVEKPEK